MDIPDLQMESLLQPQTARIDDGKESTILMRPCHTENLCNLAALEFGGQRLLPIELNPVKAGPFAAKDFDQKELQPGKADPHRRVAELVYANPVGKIHLKLVACDFVECLTKKLAEQTRLTQIQLLRRFTVARHDHRRYHPIL